MNHTGIDRLSTRAENADYPKKGALNVPLSPIPSLRVRWSDCLGHEHDFGSYSYLQLARELGADHHARGPAIAEISPLYYPLGNQGGQPLRLRYHSLDADVKGAGCGT